MPTISNKLSDSISNPNILPFINKKSSNNNLENLNSSSHSVSTVESNSPLQSPMKNFLSDLEIDPSLMLDKMIERKFNYSYGIYSEKLTRKRVEAINKILEMSEKNNIAYPCAFRAISYFDKILRINPNEFNADSSIVLLSICMVISAKFLDYEVKLPLIQNFMKANGIYLGTRMECYEMEILAKLHWDLDYISSFDFLDFFIYQGIIKENEIEEVNGITEGLMNDDGMTFNYKMKSYVKFLSSMCAKSEINRPFLFKI